MLKYLSEVTLNKVVVTLKQGLCGRQAQSTTSKFGHWRVFSVMTVKSAEQNIVDAADHRTAPLKQRFDTTPHCIPKTHYSHL